MRGRSGSILPRIAPSNIYPCKDGDIVIGANQDKVFIRLCEAMGRPEMAEDPRYKTHHARGDRQAELDAIISEWTRTQSLADLDALLAKQGVPAGPMYRPDQILSDPHFAAREAVVWQDHPTLGRIPMQNAFPKFSDTPSNALRSPAPQTVGEHNREILGGVLGLGDGDIADLQRAGVI
jgi:formyl-CoA transferase